MVSIAWTHVTAQSEQSFRRGNKLKTLPPRPLRKTPIYAYKIYTHTRTHRFGFPHADMSGLRVVLKWF